MATHCEIPDVELTLEVGALNALAKSVLDGICESPSELVVAIVLKLDDASLREVVPETDVFVVEAEADVIVVLALSDGKRFVTLHSV